MIFDPAEEKILSKTEVWKSILATIFLQNGLHIIGFYKRTAELKLFLGFQFAVTNSVVVLLFFIIVLFFNNYW